MSEESQASGIDSMIRERNREVRDTHLNDSGWLSKRILDAIKNKSLNKKKREIEELKLEIEKAKLNKELKEIKK